MIKKIISIRGMHDYLPHELEIWHKTEKILKKIFKNYGYYEIRLPILEKTELFYRSIGNVTDIIEKEMYTFYDKSKKNITLRPEATASCSRAYIENNLEKNIQQRFWYYGPMFRYERPQQGRYRQFYQFGCEVYGLNTEEIELELIILLNRCWKALNIDKKIFLEINSIGTVQSREKYKIDLVKFLISNKKKLDKESQAKLYKNPLRILDTKNKLTKKLLINSPNLLDYIDNNSKNYFKKLCKSLNKFKISYKINRNLVRGLDYYNDIVFEWKSNNKKLSSQNTICAGGRYDNLIKTLGGNSSIPALGFAIGMERLIYIINNERSFFIKKLETDIYIISNLNKKSIYHIKFAENIRNLFNNLRIVQDFNVGSIKKKIIRSKKFHSKVTIIISYSQKNKKIFQIKYYNSSIIKVLHLKKMVKELQDYFRKFYGKFI
ncbi:MAG: histidine--tRNA ligase [Buchnera aphidicola (Periphyllus aceris)]|nr:histidine--tRNA ligase [Buchnera aphidicola (Periphyllus aceris)]